MTAWASSPKNSRLRRVRHRAGAPTDEVDFEIDLLPIALAGIDPTEPDSWDMEQAAAVFGSTANARERDEDARVMRALVKAGPKRQPLSRQQRRNLQRLARSHA